MHRGQGVFGIEVWMPTGTLDCGSGCVDVTANPEHCGSCENVGDGATEGCVNYQCQCKARLTRCGGVSVDRQTGESNCGSCGVTCTGKKACKNGVCSN